MSSKLERERAERERRVLLARSPATSVMRYSVVQWVVGLTITGCVSCLGVAPLAIYGSNCADQQKFSADMRTYQTYQSLLTRTCMLDDAKACKRFEVLKMVAPQIQQRDEDDPMYAVSTLLLNGMNADEFRQHAGNPDAERERALDILLGDGVLPPEKYQQPPKQPTPTRIPWMVVGPACIAACMMCWWFALWYRRANIEQHLAWQRSHLGIDRLDAELRSTYVDILEQEGALRALIERAPTESTLERQRLLEKVEEFRDQLARLCDEQTTRDRIAREERMNAIVRELSHSCDEARARIEHLRQQSQARAEAVEVERAAVS